jgi:hypothetical protein
MIVVSATDRRASSNPFFCPCAEGASLHSARTLQRTRDYVSEEEFLVLLQGTRDSRYRWRDTAMLMRTFYHGLCVLDLCHLTDRPFGRCTLSKRPATAAYV